MNEQIWVALVLWIFLLLLGYRFKEYYIISFASVLGLVSSVLILQESWVLIGLGLVALNLYLMYVGLTNW